MAEPDAFDPTHALDGWRVPAPAPLELDLRLGHLIAPAAPAESDVVLPVAVVAAVAEPDSLDPTHALDGWRVPTPAPLDLELRSLGHVASPRPDGAKAAWLKARGYATVDIEDVELPEAPFDFAVLEASVLVVPPPADAPAPAKEVGEAVQTAFESVDAEAGPPPAEPEVRESEANADEVDTIVPEASFEPLPQDAAVQVAAPELPPAPEAATPEPMAGPAEVAEPAPASVAAVAVSAKGDTPAETGAAPPAEAPQAPDRCEAPAEPRPAAAADIPELDFQLPPTPVAVEAPVLEFAAPPPAPQADSRELLESLVLPQVPPPSPAVDVPELDLGPVAPAEPDPRLLADWRPRAWTGLARRLAGASVEVQQADGALRVDHHAAQWLCALWPPQAGAAPMLARWPELAAVVAADTSTGALEQLLDDLPPQAELWPADLDADWALVADLVARQDTGLRPAQTLALRNLAEQERSASLARIGAGYARQGRVTRRCA